MKGQEAATFYYSNSRMAAVMMMVQLLNKAAIITGHSTYSQQPSGEPNELMSVVVLTEEEKLTRE